MEESTTQTKSTTKPKPKSTTKSHSHNRSKVRTHVPVDGHTIEKLREFPIENLTKR